MLALIAILAFSLLVTLALSHFLIPRLKRFGMVGKDVNKEGRPEVAEMGGIAIVAGFTAGVLLAIMLNTFNGFEFNITYVLAALVTIHAMAFIGIVDDLLDIPQAVKAFLPLAAAVPLVAVSAAGSTAIAVPFLGEVDLGLFYIVLLIPVGVAVASNLTNMLAGFNGMEAGMGSIVMLFMAALAFLNGRVEMLVIFIPMLGALLGFLKGNWFPARVFPGDVGNLTIGAVLASGVIIGNMESAGALMLILYVADFFIKAYHRFPSSKWWGELKGGKLYPVEGKVRGFAQLIMRMSGGISERNLVLVFIGMQALVGLVVFFLYA
ncbi:MAG: glycosyltransferase 4 family protein [Candidatus Micrarchaeia archaeon]|jgi:UDP-N-acetylglucosamine--dolichyl-phosphate N-acetylglucosaminephosphotransferase